MYSRESDLLFASSKPQEIKKYLDFPLIHWATTEKCKHKISNIYQIYMNSQSWPYLHKICTIFLPYIVYTCRSFSTVYCRPYSITYHTFSLPAWVLYHWMIGLMRLHIHNCLGSQLVSCSVSLNKLWRVSLLLYISQLTKSWVFYRNFTLLRNVLHIG